MLCSKCSEHVKPILVLDIDGTIAKYHGHLMMFAREWTGLTLFSDGEYWTGHGDFEDWLHMDKSEYRQMKMAFRQGGQKRNMPFYEDMKELLVTAQRYRAEGRLEIWIATHRPWMRLDNIDPDTQHWLRRFSIPYDHLLFSDTKYEDLVQQVDRERVIMVVDDLKEMCHQASVQGLPVVQVFRLHNEADSATWQTKVEARDLPKWLSVRLCEWEAEHDEEATVSQGTAQGLIDSTSEQGAVFEEAMKVFIERNKKYGDLWKEYGAEDSLQHMRSKMMRVRQQFGGDSYQDFGPFDYDDAIDLLNYTVFFIRNMRAGRIHGQPD